MIKSLLSNEEKRLQKLEEIDDEIEIQQMLERKVKKQKKLSKEEMRL